MWWILACYPDVSAPTLACPDAGAPQVTLPADDAPHEEPVEWWYWTGHLIDGDGVWYGFEEVVFVYRLDGYEATSVHQALTTPDAFTYDVAYAHGELPQATTDGFVLEAESASAIGGDGSDRLIGQVEGASWLLDLSGARTVLQHGDGYHDYDEGYTWYASRPRMTVGGTLTLDGQEKSVTGSAWFDHQWGDLVAQTEDGWDWFALQLDDGRELMLFLELDGDLVGGTLSDPLGSCELQPEEFTVTELGEWTSEATGCTWPMGWEITVLDEVFTVTPTREDQELASSYRTYWEGAVIISGDSTGRGYVEMAGRCN
ncbi:MAG: carotenoid 1,2-hydratase [Proteobacteria bacterium]|nr:carotenoid 1,2-hydratase [Pseudomonadota bacterium]MCP4921897.1 carotenoid 1,2-hydratase [Pseudomonadota bacterium]